MAALVAFALTSCTAGPRLDPPPTAKTSPPVTTSSLPHRAPIRVNAAPVDRDLTVSFRLAAGGWCVGQFVATATETDTDVVISDVAELPLARSCMGIATFAGEAYTIVQLATPLGNRRVVYATTGAALPVVAG